MKVLNVYSSIFQYCNTTQAGIITISNGNFQCCTMFKNQAYLNAVFRNRVNSKINFCSAFDCAGTSYPLESYGIFELNSYNSSQIFSINQASALRSVGRANIIYSQFIECGPDESGATVETYNEESNFTMSNFVNMTSICTAFGFLTIGKAHLFMDKCFIETINSKIFISTFKPNGTEHITISNSNIITKVSIITIILETTLVNTQQSQGELTFADIMHASIPSCNYSEYECTCEINSLLFNNFQFFLLFEIFILFEF